MDKYPKLSYTALGDKISIRLGVKHKMITGLSDEEMDNLVRWCEGYSKYSDKETAYKKIMRYMDPSTIIEEFEGLKVNGKGQVFLEGTSIPMPKNLSQRILSLYEKNRDITPLINFWTLCLLNPNSTARDGFFKYIEDFGIIITSRGYALLYKAVNKEDRSVVEEWDEFVSKAYLKAQEQGRNPHSIKVYKGRGSGNYYTSTPGGFMPEVHEELLTIGSLEKLYRDLHNEEYKEDKTTFVPSHKGKYGMEIKLGEPNDMPREECDPDITKSCSYGYHVGSYKYVKKFGRNMDAILATLVNPKDVVALPEYDHSKIRVCEYLPYAVIERDEDGGWDELESEYFEDDFLKSEVHDLAHALSLLEGHGIAGATTAQEYEDKYDDLNAEEIKRILRNRLKSVNN